MLELLCASFCGSVSTVADVQCSMVEHVCALAVCGSVSTVAEVCDMVGQVCPSV